MEVNSTSGEDDIISSVFRRKKRTKVLSQKAQDVSESDDEKALETSSKTRARSRKFVFKDDDSSECDDESDNVATVSAVDTPLIHQAGNTQFPTRNNQLSAPSPEPTRSKRKTRNVLKQERTTNLHENYDDGGFKIDSLLSKHSDLFDCDSDADEHPSASPPVDEWHGKSQAVKQKRNLKTPRLNKKEQFKLHSEAQRVVRETNICLPKYQPKVKTLDDFLTKLKSTSTQSIKPSMAIKRGKESFHPDAALSSKTVLSQSSVVTSSPVGCQEETPTVMSEGLQAETATAVTYTKDTKASQDVMPTTSHCVSPNEAVLHCQDASPTETVLQGQNSFLLELENTEQSQSSNTVTKGHVNKRILKAVKEVPAPKLCSHNDWGETDVISPVEELQRRFFKHATIILPEVVEDSVLTRDELKSTLYKQVVERRALERRAIEEATKLDNEEFSPAESEAELTDEGSLASDYNPEETEKAMDIDNTEVSRDKNSESNNDPVEEEENQSGWQSDSSCSSSDDDDCVDSNEGDEDSDDELTVRNKKSAKHLDSDSDCEIPQVLAATTTAAAMIRNFPFDEATEQSRFNNTQDTSNDVSCKDGEVVDKKIVDSGLGTSLLTDVSPGGVVFHDATEGNAIKYDDVTLTDSVAPKRPSEDDTNITAESGSLLSNATELDRSSSHFDEETQFLDSNGFLNVKPKNRQSPTLELDESTMPEFSSQLIQLCSGKFSPKENISNGSKTELRKPHEFNQNILRKDSKDLPTTQGVRELLSGYKEPISKPLVKSISSVLLESSHCEGDNSQLLALCSGNFSSQFTSFSRAKQETSDGMTDDESSSDDGDELMMLTKGRRSAGYSQCTPAVNNFDDEASDDEIPRLSKRKNRKLLKNIEKSIKRRRLEEFVESEAELSGSDHGMPSDEERAYLDNEDDDVLERWSGDSDVDVSEDELKKQVNRVHMKYTLADDSANVKDIKERFLPGGDLYENGLMLKDGFFRKRKFAHVGSEASVDLFADERVLDNGDEQFDDDNSQAEAMRRKERLEKDEFLSEMRRHDSILGDEDSQQLLKLVKPASVKLSATAINRQRPATVQLYTTRTVKHSCGSFLKRNKAELSKLSSSVATATSVSTSSSKNFVFQTGVTTPSEQTAPQLKKSHSVRTKPGKSPRKPSYKRSRSLPQDENSVFNVLN